VTLSTLLCRSRTIIAILAALTACGPRDLTSVPAADVTFSVRRGSLTGPDSIGPGWGRVRVEEGRGGHRVVIFRLAESMSDADLTSFLAALDTANITPAPALALGGSEIGETGDVVLQLTPGRYVLGCVVCVMRSGSRSAMLRPASRAIRAPRAGAVRPHDARRARPASRAGRGRDLV
jgi:hypothetical protein